MNDFHDILKEMRKNPIKQEKRRSNWNKSEDDKLTEYYLDGYGISEIAIALKRTENGIVKRIKSLNLEQKIYEKHEKFFSSENCLCRQCDNRFNCDSCKRNTKNN